MMSPARWFAVPYFVTSHFVGGIFAFPLALMFLNYAVKRRSRMFVGLTHPTLAACGHRGVMLPS